MKSKGVAYLLWFFLGILGIHRFYLGKVGTGLFFLFTLGWGGIGWFIDLFLISTMVDSVNAKYQIAQTQQMIMNGYQAPGHYPPQGYSPYYPLQNNQNNYPQ